MRHPKIIIAGLGLGVLAAAGGITAAAAGSPPAASGSAGPTVVRAVPTTVAGKTETVLADGQGLPLYYYRPDTATRSPAPAAPSSAGYGY